MFCAYPWQHSLPQKTLCSPSRPIHTTAWRSHRSLASLCDPTPGGSRCGRCVALLGRGSGGVQSSLLVVPTPWRHCRTAPLIVIVPFRSPRCGLWFESQSKQYNSFGETSQARCLSGLALQQPSLTQHSSGAAQKAAQPA